MPAVEDPRALGELELFHGLSPEDLTYLNGHLRSSIVPPGTNFITVEQPGEVVYVILEGTVKIYVSHEDGREVILAFLGRGDTVGEMSLIDSSGRSANVVTTEKSRLLWMDRTTFQTCLRTLTPLANNLVRLLDVAGRVARQILALAERYGSREAGGQVTIPLRLTQSDLGEIVGASRERVNQVIVELKQRGAIAVQPDHRIQVLNRKDLARYCR
jgi:CRP/FNR family cyclic AMP-dependent transcriptional regulator